MKTFVVVTGPSTSGKSSLVNALLAKEPQWTRLVTTTTRSMRPGETEGVHYHYVSPSMFSEMEDDDAFIESVETYGNRYGSTWQALENALTRSDIVLAVIDPRGARAFFPNTKLARYTPRIISLFIVPGDPQDLRKRLIERGGVCAGEEFDRRYGEVAREIELADEFDYQVTNRDGQFDVTVAHALSLLRTRIASRI